MCEILYRGKRADNGERVEGYYFCMVHPDDRHSHHFIIPLGRDLSKGTPIEKIQVEVIPETVGQYTKFDDKNGKKIFTGHLVKVGSYVGKVVLTDGCYMVEFLEPVPDRDCLCFVASDCEVIGTIWDNPELLKGGEQNG